MTNHVVVAMIEDAVKQTRCTTCDADHEYKQARVPSPRRPKSVAAIQDGAESFEAKPVLAAPARIASEPPSEPEPEEPSLSQPEAVAAMPEEAPVPMAASAETLLADEPRVEPGGEDEGPVHRPLIRAQLPRPEGHVPERREPEFTIRQPGARGGGGGGQRGGREVDGNSTSYRPKGGGQRQGGFGHGGGQSRFGGQRHGSGQQPRHGGGRGPNGGQRSGRPDGMGNSRGQRGPGSGRRRGGR